MKKELSVEDYIRLSKMKRDDPELNQHIAEVTNDIIQILQPNIIAGIMDGFEVVFGRKHKVTGEMHSYKLTLVECTVTGEPITDLHTNATDYTADAMEDLDKRQKP